MYFGSYGSYFAWLIKEHSRKGINFDDRPIIESKFERTYPFTNVITRALIFRIISNHTKILFKNYLLYNLNL